MQMCQREGWETENLFVVALYMCTPVQKTALQSTGNKIINQSIMILVL